MKLAEKILGAVVLVVLIVVISLTFVVSNNVFNLSHELSTANNTGGEVAGADIILVGTMAFLVMLDMVGYMIFIGLGIALIIYAIIFIVYYIRNLQNKNTVQFNIGNIIILSLIFIILVINFASNFASNTSGMLKGFLCFAILALTSIAYSIISIIAQKRALAMDLGDDENSDGEAPEIIFYDEKSEDNQDSEFENNYDMNYVDGENEEESK
ncbi:MAG: hypothetical protein RR357_02080 [Clostridia bacterium]